MRRHIKKQLTESLPIKIMKMKEQDVKWLLINSVTTFIDNRNPKVRNDPLDHFVI